MNYERYILKLQWISQGINRVREQQSWADFLQNERHVSKSKVDLQVFVKSASQRLLVNKEGGGVWSTNG